MKRELCTKKYDTFAFLSFSLHARTVQVLYERKDGRIDGRTITNKPKFLSFMGLKIFFSGLGLCVESKRGSSAIVMLFTGRQIRLRKNCTGGLTLHREHRVSQFLVCT